MTRHDSFSMKLLPAKAHLRVVSRRKDLLNRRSGGGGKTETLWHDAFNLTQQVNISTALILPSGGHYMTLQSTSSPHENYGRLISKSFKFNNGSHLCVSLWIYVKDESKGSFVSFMIWTVLCNPVIYVTNERLRLSPTLIFLEGIIRSCS